MLVAFVLGPIWAIGPVAPSPASGAETLPACRYDDVETAFTSTADWPKTLVDTIFMVGRSYVPPDLVPVTKAGISGNGEIRSIVIPDLRAMAEAAQAAGAPIAVESAYRSYATQVYTFTYWAQHYGEKAALMGSARPGHSEHQLGVAIDFRSAGTDAQWTGDWATTPAGGWMAANAWQYGFVMSYPAATSPGITCYRYEPWHYRYVGRDEAAAIHAADTTIRQYLWYRTGNAAILAGRSATTPLPAATSTPTTAPSATPTPSPTPTPRASPTASFTPAAAAGGGSSTPSVSAAAGVGGQATGPGGRDRQRSPLELLLRALGTMLGIVVGLLILAAAERLNRALLRDDPRFTLA